MSKIVLKSLEQNINYLNSNTVASGYKLYPVRYTTIDGEELVKAITKNSYVPQAFVSASVCGITEAIENYLLNGHSIELPGFGIFSLSCECKTVKSAEDAGLGQFRGLNINFRPSMELKQKLANVDLALDGIWKCLDLTADEKVYQRITTTTNHDSVELPNGDGDEVVEPNNPSDGGNNNPGGNNPGGGGFEG